MLAAARGRLTYYSQHPPLNLPMPLSPMMAGAGRAWAHINADNPLQSAYIPYWNDYGGYSYWNYGAYHHWSGYYGAWGLDPYSFGGGIDSFGMSYGFGFGWMGYYGYGYGYGYGGYGYGYPYGYGYGHGFGGYYGMYGYRSYGWYGDYYGYYGYGGYGYGWNWWHNYDWWAGVQPASMGIHPDVYGLATPLSSDGITRPALSGAPNGISSVDAYLARFPQPTIDQLINPKVLWIAR